MVLTALSKNNWIFGVSVDVSWHWTTLRTSSPVAEPTDPSCPAIAVPWLRSRDATEDRRAPNSCDGVSASYFLLIHQGDGSEKNYKEMMHHRCYFSFCVFCMIFSSYIIANTMMIKPAASCNFCLRLNAGIWYLEWKLPRHADTRWHKTHKIICNKLTMGHVSQTDESYSFNGLPTRFIHKASMVQRPNIDFQRGTLRIPVVHTKKHHPYWY